METFESDDGDVIINLWPGEDMLEGIQQACEDHEVDTGVVVSGIGSLTKLDIHWVVPYDDFPELTSDRPKRMERVESEGAWEVGSLQGAIANGSPHLHITAYEAEDDRMVCGHLESGCIVHTLAEIVIRKIDGPELTREPNQWNISMLQER